MSDDDEFAEGTRLRYPIHDERGVLLLNGDAAITRKILALLQRRGIKLTLHASLEVTAGAALGTTIVLQEQNTNVGRHPTCTIRPRGRDVSHFHCRFEKRPLSLSVVDLESTNGTWVNGVPIREKTLLHDRDVVTFGKYAVRVDLNAVLESDGGDAAEVAQLILAERGNDMDPETGETILASGDLIRDLRWLAERDSAPHS